MELIIIFIILVIIHELWIGTIGDRDAISRRRKEDEKYSVKKHKAKK